LKIGHFINPTGYWNNSFHPLDTLQKLLKHTEILHLWNAKINKTFKYHHYPLLPNLNPEDGWMDVEKYFKVIRAENKKVKFFFEHRSDLISKVELDTCYEWIYSLYKK
jgi:hypothetical protein